MTSKQWEQVESIFHAAADLPPEAQGSFLQSRCEGDEDLIEYILRLLERDRHPVADGVLTRKIDDVASVLLDEPDHDLVPRRLGPYRLVRELGHGGMGIVYLAERFDLGNQVAIKVLRQILPSAKARERFAGEQKMLASLVHPNIARFYDAGTQPDGTSFFVLEYVDGIPLTEYCRLHDLSYEDRIGLLIQTCEAVQFAHGHAIIHRDLKPSNILVKADGSVRLLDFGIAKSLIESRRSESSTASLFQPMTPAYAAPEQMCGQSIGTFTDVYALGVILFELLTDSLPYDLSNLSPAEAERVITEQEPKNFSDALRASSPPRGTTSRSVWSDLEVICLTAMHRDVTRRYQSAEALVRDLHNLLSGNPIEARPDSLAYRTQKFVSRNSRVLAGTAVVLAIIGALISYFAVHLKEARDTAVSEAARTARVQAFMLDLFKGDDTTGPAGLQVETLLDRGTLQVQNLKADPTLQASLFSTLGQMYAQLGRFDRASSLLTSSLHLNEKTPGQIGEKGLIEDLVSLGIVKADQGHLEEGQRLIEKGMAAADSLKPPNPLFHSRALTALAVVHNRRGNYKAAAQAARDAIALGSKYGAESEMGASLTELSDAYFYEGRYSEAEAASRQALTWNRRYHGSTHPAVAEDLINLASVQEMQDHLPEAEQSYRAALGITEAWYGDLHPETATVRTQLAQTLVLLHRYDEAIDLLKRALAAQERTYGPVHPRVALALNALGMAESGRGHDLASADYYKRALETYRRVNGDKHYTVAVAMTNWGSAYLNQRDYGRAEAIFREAVARLKAVLPPNHINTAVAEIKLGRTLLREKRYREAIEESAAAHGMLLRQSNPPAAWLNAVCKDLASEHDALGQRAEADRFRTELRRLTTQPTKSLP